jgi:D-psicose/D-tagatose/L-ribulose 3-epimerase
MNKIGIYYAYWTHEWDADFHPFIDKVAKLGFDLLEVNGGTVARMTPQERQRLKAHADAAQVALSYCVGENNRMPPGFGHIPWTEIGAALRKINYQGAVVMEPFLMPGGQVGRDIKVFRDLSVNLDLDDQARKAMLFMRGILK